MGAARCCACGRYVTRSAVFEVDWSSFMPGFGRGWYHPYSRDSSIPCGPVPVEETTR